MSLMTAYLVTSKNADAFFKAIRTAKAPDKFTTKFLKDLDFTSSNDRLFIGLLKGLGFLDDTGAPTERYFAYLDHSQSGRVLADAIQHAYDELFALNKNAQKLSVDEVKGKFKSLTQGQKSENVIGWMANTFKTLCDLADWSAPASPSKKKTPPVVPTETPHSESEVQTLVEPVTRELELHYNIQIILPESRDQAVYDALFSSLRRHLL